MFRSVFRPYGPLWNFFNHITDVLLLSLLWCVCSIPLITVGTATAAMYDAVVRGVRSDETSCWKRYWHTFRNEWKTGALISLLWGIILLIGSYILALLNQIGQEDSGAALTAGAYSIILLIPLAAACWSAILLSRTTGTFGSLTATAVKLLPAHLASSALIAVTAFAACWYCSRYPLGLTFAPALCAIVWSFPAEKVLAKYGVGLLKEKKTEEEANA